MNDQELKQLIESNARAIESLSTNAGESRKDFNKLYQLMANLAQTEADSKKEMYRIMANMAENQAESKVEMYRIMANMAENQAESKKEIYQMMGNLDNRQNELSKRQGEIVEVLKILTKNQNNNHD